MEGIAPIFVSPGQRFDISLIGLGQTNHPVSAIVMWDTQYTDDEYRLSPLSRTIGNSCTSVSFQLYSESEDFSTIEFKLYPDNPCQNLIDGLKFDILLLCCPVGFDFSGKEYICVCNWKLRRFTQNCYIDYDSESVEQTENSFWIYKESYNVLFFYEFRCPLDYCTNDPLNVSLSDPSVQCDFNRTGTLCG